MDFPTFDKNANRPTQAIAISPPAFDANASGAKTPEQLVVEQQWRDADTMELDKQHPLSINRDAAQVTADPYTA